MATTEKPARHIGASPPRKEDPAFVTGQARYTDDLTVPGMLHVAFVRSPFAHATINGIDTTAATAAEGVAAVLTADDLADDIAAPVVCAWPIVDDIKIGEHWPLVKDKARYAGDKVAMVVADTRAGARDAAELVEVDYDPLPAVTDVEEALADGAPLVYDDFESNLAMTWRHNVHSPVPPRATPEEVFPEADVVIKEKYKIQRAVPNAIEPRSVIVEPTPASGEFTMWSATQIPHIVRTVLTLMTGVPEAKLRVIAPAVGGGFGSKLQVYGEEALVLAASRKLGRALKWTEDRQEAFVAQHHGRDVVQEIELAADRDGNLRGVRVRLWASMGAYMVLLTPGIPLLGGWLYCGPYEADAYDLEINGVYTNTTFTDAYRGAGRPEATYCIERAMDALARELDMDPVELRRKNFVPTEAFPNHTIVSGLVVDTGDYHASLDRLIQEIDYDGLRAEQKARRESGDTKQLGIGLSTWLEMCGLAPSRVAGAINLVCGLWEAAQVRVMPTGTVQVMVGVTAHGQGHATTFSQIVADELGVEIDDVEIIAGDTKQMALGMDTYGSRSLAVGGIALHHANQKVVAKARTIAANALECAEEDLDYDAGTFTVKGTDRSMHVKEAAFAAWTAHSLPDGMEPGLEATHVYDPPNFSWPGGAHACIVEVDTETGEVEIRRYVAVDDCGVLVNPQVVEGQVHGGVAQGIAEALYEEAIYDEEGNLVNGSMMSYLVPSAAEIPHIELFHTSTPSPTNPLGVKGVGEAGTIASPPAIINAIIDALSDRGVTDVKRPATPENVWRAIQEARQ